MQKPSPLKIEGETEMSLPIITMGELGDHSPELGNKVKNLASLAQAGIRVPRGFGLPFSVYSAYAARLIPVLERIREQQKDYAVMAKQMHDVIVSSTLHDASDVQTALEKHISGASFFAVRSSGAPIVKHMEMAEDSSGISLAGQYESFLLVPARNVPQAILHCYASLFSERCLRRFKVAEDAGYLWSRMSVLIQEMCPAELSSVIMTRDPVEGDNYFGMEITYGACEAIVSGEVQGDLYLLDRTTGAIINAEIGTKNSRISYEPLTDWEAGNKIKLPVPEAERRQFAASQRLVTSIYDLGMLVENHFGVPQDIELVVSHGEIVVTQSRPITTGH